MAIVRPTNSLIRAGDLDGLGRVYTESGELIPQPGESILHQRKGCDVAAYGSWRVFFAKRIFSPLSGRPAGEIFVTPRRLVFVRDIDVWKEVRPLLTPLGLPTAAEKEARLKNLRSRGAHQYCEVFSPHLSIARVKRKRAMLHLRLVGTHAEKYELFVATDSDDPSFFDLLENNFRRTREGP